MGYEELLIEAYKLDIDVKEKPLKSTNGLCVGNRIAIEDTLSNIEKCCALAEEIGHYKLTVGNITDQTKIQNRKQELLARRWGYEKLVSIMDLIRAYNHGCQNRYEIAEYLNVTEEFLNETLEFYRCKYPDGCSIKSYWLDFDSGLNIFKKY